MTKESLPGEVFDELVIGSVETFLDSCNNNVFDSLRALQRIKTDWVETEENKDCRKSTILRIAGIESLMVDIAEAQAGFNLTLLEKYEQS